MYHVLLVEDDKNLQDSLKNYLEGEGFKVSTASFAAEAQKKILLQPDIIILDWMLGDGTGIDLVQQWRKASILCPVLFLTAKVELTDKILGLEFGADDYITKPFEPRELLSRIRVQLRRKSMGDQNTVSFNAVIMDTKRKEVTHQGSPLELTKMEYFLLKLFLESPGTVFSREEILNQVWGYDSFPTTRTVDTHVLQLRQKIPSLNIETVRGMGYRLKEQEKK